jgi:nickel-type superoxide dismutase maturation protease
VIYLDRSKLRAMGETAAWLVGRRRRIKVTGDSMLPTLAPGQFVLVDPSRAVAVDDLALAHHPHEADLLIIKRVAEILDDGRVMLVSDNQAAGTDSRTWGPLSASAIQGVVTLLLDHPSG